MDREKEISLKAVKLITDYANKNYLHLGKEQRELELELFEYVGGLESDVEELAEMALSSVYIEYMFEDELPKNIPDDVYDAMFNCSKVDFVRLFPFVNVDGKKLFLIDPQK